MSKNWIAGAIKHRGSFTRQAHEAGESVQEYAREKQHAGGTTGRRANLAITLNKLAKRRKK